MLIVLFVAFSLIGVLGTLFYRRHRRRREWSSHPPTRAGLQGSQPDMSFWAPSQRSVHDLEPGYGGGGGVTSAGYGASHGAYGAASTGTVSTVADLSRTGTPSHSFPNQTYPQHGHPTSGAGGASSHNYHSNARSGYGPETDGDERERLGFAALGSSKGKGREIVRGRDGGAFGAGTGSRRLKKGGGPSWEGKRGDAR